MRGKVQFLKLVMGLFAVVSLTCLILTGCAGKDPFYTLNSTPLKDYYYIFQHPAYNKNILIGPIYTDNYMKIIKNRLKGMPLNKIDSDMCNALLKENKAVLISLKKFRRATDAKSPVGGHAPKQGTYLPYKFVLVASRLQVRCHDGMRNEIDDFNWCGQEWRANETVASREMVYFVPYDNLYEKLPLFTIINSRE